MTNQEKFELVGKSVDTAKEKLREIAKIENISDMFIQMQEQIKKIEKLQAEYREIFEIAHAKPDEEYKLTEYEQLFGGVE